MNPRTPGYMAFSETDLAVKPLSLKCRKIFELATEFHETPAPHTLEVEALLRFGPKCSVRLEQERLGETGY